MSTLSGSISSPVLGADGLPRDLQLSFSEADLPTSNGYRPCHYRWDLASATYTAVVYSPSGGSPTTYWTGQAFFDSEDLGWFRPNADKVVDSALGFATWGDPSDFVGWEQLPGWHFECTATVTGTITNVDSGAVSAAITRTTDVEIAGMP
jgi:hypothetical protein